MPQQELIIALKNAAPELSLRSIERFANLLSQSTSQHISNAELSQQLSSIPEIAQILQLLAGEQLQVNRQLISFGESNQLGDVQIHDVIGGNSYQLTINIHTNSPATTPQPSASPEKTEHKAEEPQPTTEETKAAEIQEKQALIEQHKRRLHKLQIQSATYGISADPSILIQIEDIEKEIAQLRREIGS